MHTLLKHILRFQLPLLSFNVLQDFFSNQSLKLDCYKLGAPTFCALMRY